MVLRTSKVFLPLLVVVAAAASYVAILGASTHHFTIVLLGLVGILVAISAAWETFAIYLVVDEIGVTFRDHWLRTHHLTFDEIRDFTYDNHLGLFVTAYDGSSFRWPARSGNVAEIAASIRQHMVKND